MIDSRNCAHFTFERQRDEFRSGRSAVIRELCTRCGTVLIEHEWTKEVPQ